MDSEERGILEWMNHSRNRALLVAVFNFTVRTMELVFQMDHIIAGGGIDPFLNQNWDYLASFFLLRVLPMLLGLLLLFAVVGDHARGCFSWCISELLVISIYLILHSTSEKPGIAWDSSLMIYGYCILRLISIIVIYDFITQLLHRDEQAKEFEKVFFRNQFWHQLSIHHMEKEHQNQINMEKESQLKLEKTEPLTKY